MAWNKMPIVIRVSNSGSDACLIFGWLPFERLEEGGKTF